MKDAIELIERLVNQTGKVVSKPRHPADVMATWADISKAKRLLEWQPRTRFEEGVKRLARWYHENRQWAKDVVTD